MTTQWNPAYSHGDFGASHPGRDEEGMDRANGDHTPGSGGGKPEHQDEPTHTESGPWRGYTMPVPEHPDHALAPEPSSDGITGYPEQPAGRRRDEQTRAAHAEGAPPQGGQAEPQRRPGKHARPSDVEEQDQPARATGHDDPDGLAGWVGSLTEAADDSRIAGRGTGGFPAVAPQEHPEQHTAQEPRSEPENSRQQSAKRQGSQQSDVPEPLPRRVPGPSAVSGAFRAVGPDIPEPSTASRAVDPGDSRKFEEEYRPTTHDSWRPTRSTTRAELVERLEALATLRDLGQENLPQEVIGRASQLLDHAGARLRLSEEHTVVALAGGTGSGKSSLFNALCGLELSQTGITRPTTSKAHACVWGHEGADSLLGWLGVPPQYRHSRTGVLDASNSELTGLVLLDLPDHDSVRSMHTAEADRLIGSVDLLVWVLDPQKYADAAIHHRYLARMAGHGAVTVAVLNKVDRVEPEELEELLTDLRRLLETESGVHPRVITTSTVTDQGVDELREFLSETVAEHHAMVDRLAADLDVVVADFADFQGKDEIPRAVPSPVRAQVQQGLSNAAGVTAVADVTETNDVNRGKREVGWPVARRLLKMRKDPLAAVQLDFLRQDTDQHVAGRVDAHEAELETVLGEAADQVSEDMPAPWRKRMRVAARSHLNELPTELGDAVGEAVSASERTPSWWRFARIVQYLLLIVVGLGLAWSVVSALSWVGDGITGLRMFDDPVFVAYSGALATAALVVGWLTGVGCGNLVEVAAVQRREDVERNAEGRVREITGLRVIQPMEVELERCRAFRAAYEVARGAD